MQAATEPTVLTMEPEAGDWILCGLAEDGGWVQNREVGAFLSERSTSGLEAHSRRSARSRLKTAWGDRSLSVMT